ncbi:MAG TPA: UDP-2,3-diacylglucosamine diphosphatase LpxI [Planctomycetaceae bacterium]|nr:UDP-2,3-diacylglucosamine diphosphatase LpxI [Planctomycetaceae bacterium]HQZ64656.1 UDP-2,3-diacylglucosamine diphosphatase LpxI [Planctomycetaceae bacterium]HRA90191.1 UDP-2,3-diacylglucosamine diphosphatase LpxI [Planctomycetaceae bacterium]
MLADQESESHPVILPFVRPLAPCAANSDSGAESLPPMRLGLLAGGGEFPIRFARAARNAGHYVFGLGVAGMASEELAEECDEFRFAPLARLGKAIRLYRKAQVQRIIMAGKIEKTVLFHPFRWLRLMPDWRAFHMWYRYARENKKDDTILLAVIREFERDGLIFDSALKYCPELLVKHGFLTHRRPSATQWKDIRFGWDLAREMGRLDIGQTVVVNDTAVIAVEAIEGTDRCIKRAGELCRRGGFTVVKVAKPQQDMRFDVPTIGIETIKNMHESGGKVLAIESGMTIIISPEEVTDLADKFGICIVAVNADELALLAAA